MNNEAEMNAQDSKKSQAKVKAKEYGQEALKPIMNVLKKNHSLIEPYFGSVEKALRGAVEALNGENSSDSDQRLAGWIKSSQQMIEQSQQSLQNQDYSSIAEKLQQIAQRNPAVAFVGSYIAGLGLGRIGRHVAKVPKAQKPINESVEPFQMENSQDNSLNNLH
jgi:hypothetical protein